MATMNLGRRLGKTTAAIEWLIQNPEDRIVVCATKGDADAFLKHLGFYLRDDPNNFKHDWAKCVTYPGKE